MQLSSEVRRTAERGATDPLLQQSDILVQEIQHRVANSLQIIGGILLIKAKTVQSEESRSHLRDAYHRILSVATVQRHLVSASDGGPIEFGPYLARLCDTLSAAIIDDSRRISLRVKADAGSVLPDDAMKIGLIITELVINALKYAFPSGDAGRILVKYQVDGASRRLSVSDNGVGLRKNGHAPTGLGTRIVEALAQQLDAGVEIASSPHGTTVSITRGT